MQPHCYGDYGGAYVPETLVRPLTEIAEAFQSCQEHPQFHAELSALLQDFAGRLTSLAYAVNLSRMHYQAVTDVEALAAFELLAKTEGIIPALESAHAIALMLCELASFPEHSAHLVNLSGRGAKDLHTYMSLKEGEQ
jgi:tryptophan synthase beta subunit